MVALLAESEVEGMPPLPAPPPLDGPEGPVEVPPKLVPYGLEEDYWDPHPGRMARARIHVQARKELYEPALDGHDSAGGGPVLADLSDERVTQAIFTMDGTQDVRRDKWYVLQDGARSCRHLPRSGTEGSGQV